MDLLWKTPEFSARDIKTLTFNEGEECKVIYGPSTKDDGHNITKATISTSEDWTAWLNHDVFDIYSPSPSMAIILCPRAQPPKKPNRLLDQAAILRYLPFSEAVLRDIINKFHLHRAFSTIINRGWPTFSRIVHKRETGRTCITYNLRIDQSWVKDTALSISYFPATATAGSKVFALFLGCSGEDIKTISRRLATSASAATSSLAEKAPSLQPPPSNEKQKGHANGPTTEIIEVAPDTEATAVVAASPQAPASGPAGAAPVSPVSLSDPATAAQSPSGPTPPAFHPFALINLFIELEKRRRFDQVEEKVTQMENLVKNFGRLPLDLGDDLGHGQHDHSGAQNDEDPNNLVGLYLDVGHIKNGLQAWKAQLGGIRPFVGEMIGEPRNKLKKARRRVGKARSGKPRGGSSSGSSRSRYDDDDEDLDMEELSSEEEQDAAREASVVVGGAGLDPAEYLQRTLDEYDVKIGKCEMVMEGTSLTFQMELSHLARQDANITIKDGKQMKAIAVLTMFFLPATFVATFMAIPIFRWDPSDTDGRISDLWYVYFAISVPLTTVVLIFYCYWIKCCAGRRAKVYTGIPMV